MIYAINTDAAKAVIDFKDTLNAFLDFAKNPTEWAKVNEEISKAQTLVEQAQAVDDKLKETRNIELAQSERIKKAEAAESKADKKLKALEEKTLELKQLEATIYPKVNELEIREKVCRKKEADLDTREAAISAKEQEAHIAKAEANKKITELDKQITEYKQAVSKLNSIQVG